MTQRILVLGDSLTFGRPNHDIYYEDTWPGILEAKGYRIFHRGRGGGDMVSTLSELNQLCGYMRPKVGIKKPFDCCVIQVGIVDVTPRVFSRRVLRLLDFVPASSRFVKKISRSRKLTEMIGRPWVNLQLFIDTAKSIYLRAGEISNSVLFLEIARPTNFLINNAGDFSDRVALYNSCLQTVAEKNFIEVYGGDKPDIYILPDGHHLANQGHRLIADLLNIKFNSNGNQNHL